MTEKKMNMKALFQIGYGLYAVIDFDFTNFEDMDLLNIPKSHK